MDWIKTTIRESPIVQGGLTLMIAGWIGYQARATPSRVLSVLRARCTRVIEIRESSPLYDAWLAMVTEGAVRRGGPRTLEVRAMTDDYDERAAASEYAAGADEFWSRINGRWCRVAVSQESPGQGEPSLIRRFVIRVEVLFGSRADLSALLRAAKARANVVQNRQMVDLCNKYGSTSTITLPKRHPSTLCLPEGMFEGVRNRVVEFMDSREDYERVGVPWRFGILLYGEPGTGKTSIAHTLASETNCRLAVIPLADLRSDEDLFSAFGGVRDDAIVLIEDADCAFHQRDGEDADGITFSGFLNCIDGVIAAQNGRILIMSTNHIDRLDPALIRPGRVDLKLEVPLLTNAAATDYVDRLFAHVPTRHGVVREVMAEKRPTSAILINRLMREPWRRYTNASQSEQSSIQTRTPARRWQRRRRRSRT